jgi:hypothetical protein
MHFFGWQRLHLGASSLEWGLPLDVIQILGQKLPTI